MGVYFYTRSWYGVHHPDFYDDLPISRSMGNLFSPPISIEIQTMFSAAV